MVRPALHAPPPISIPAEFREAEHQELDLNRPEGALELYRSLFTTHSAKALALSRVARCLAKLGRPVEAQAAWRKLAASYPDDRDLSHRPYGIIAAIEVGDTAGAIRPNLPGQWELAADQAEYFLSQLDTAKTTPYLERFRFARQIDEQFRPRSALREGELYSDAVGAHKIWDGRAKTLEQQVLEPIFNPKELALTQPELERRTELKAADVAAALASYVRTIRSGDSSFDRYVAGKTSALTAIEKAGLALFRGKGNCWMCHTGPNFTDERPHNTGIAWRNGKLSDIGNGSFKTPTLREVARTAPYMHDGSLKSLEEVVDFYSEGGRKNPSLDPEIRRLNLDSQEKSELTAFLRTLTGRVSDGRF